MEARTFHSFFLYMLRRQGVTEDILHDTSLQHLAVKLILREMGLQDSYQPETILAILSSYKMNLTDVEDIPAAGAQEKELKTIFNRYEQWKSERGLMDFDDILLRSYHLLQRTPGVLHSLQNRFRYIMIDEFQDTNRLQYKLLRMLAYPANNLMVVGDDDQTIYGFNGASSEYILRFDKQYPEAAVVTLDNNYRSTRAILGLGNEIIRRNIHRRPKTLKAALPVPDGTTALDGLAVSGGLAVPGYFRPNDADDEAKQVLRHIREAVESGKRSYGDFAVLYRSASNSRAVLEQLLTGNMPYVDYGDGVLLYEQGVVKPLVAHLRLSLHRRDFGAIEQVAPTLYMNREQAMRHIREQDAPRPVKGPLAHLLSFPGLKEFQQAKIRERLELLRSLAAMKPKEAIRRMRTGFYEAFLDADQRGHLTTHKETLLEMLDEVELSAGRFGTVEEFVSHVDGLQEIALQRNRDRTAVQGDRIALMTIHKSKGLEFPVVFLLGASEGSLPHSSALETAKLEDTGAARSGGAGTARAGGVSAGSSSGSGNHLEELAAAALEEERRLAYVAVTRAREELYISSPAIHRGKKAAVSRFLLAAFSPMDKAAKPGTLEPTPELRGRSSPEPGELDSSGRSQLDSTHKQESRNKESVLVWRCTKKGCGVWIRISSYAEAHRETRTCPSCQSLMEKGSRKI